MSANPVVEAIEQLESRHAGMSPETAMLLKLAKEAQLNGGMPDLSVLQTNSPSTLDQNGIHHHSETSGLQAG